MVRKMCVLFVVFTMTILTGCQKNQFWCDYCRMWYYNVPSHNVTVDTVDYIVCEECYMNHFTTSSHNQVD